MHKSLRAALQRPRPDKNDKTWAGQSRRIVVQQTERKARLEGSIAPKGTAEPTARADHRDEAVGNASVSAAHVRPVKVSQRSTATTARDGQWVGRKAVRRSAAETAAAAMPWA